MATINIAQFEAWVGLYFWPFTRIAGCLMVAPIFGTRTVPRRARLAIALAVTVLVAPLLRTPNIALLSGGGIVIIVQQMIIGVAMGFAMQLVFDAVIMGGQLLANTMGLSFAVNVDPLHGASTPVLGQFYTIVIALTFLALNGHLLLLDALVQSFDQIPIGAEEAAGASENRLWAVAQLGTSLFTGAVQVALPGLTALLIVNAAFGVMSRVAPTLNLFSVGFPATLALGLAIVVAGLPLVQDTFIRLMSTGFSSMSRVLGN